MSLILRPYQQESVDDITKALTTNQSVLFQLPTGAGKTVIFTELVKENPNKRFLIMVHRKEVVLQIVEKLESIGIIPGIIMSKYKGHVDRIVQVASIQTISQDNRLDLYSRHKFDYIIIDEAHHSDANSYIKTIAAKYQKNKDIKLLGVTATPTRLGKKKGLHKLYDTLITSKSIRWLIDNGYLAEFVTYTTSVPDLHKLKLTGGDYQITSLSKYMMQPEMIDKVIDSYEAVGGNKKNIVFCVDTAHAAAITNKFKSNGHPAELLLGTTPTTERTDIMRKFKSGEINIIVSVMVLTEGIDVPDTGCIQIARPTKSLILYMQAVGRGLRPKPDGSNLTIIDNSGAVREHGLIDLARNWSLDPNVNPTTRVFGEKMVGYTAKGVMLYKDFDLYPVSILPPNKFVSEFSHLIKHNRGTNEALKLYRKQLVDDIMKLIYLKCTFPYEVKHRTHSLNDCMKADIIDREEILLSIYFNYDGTFRLSTNKEEPEYEEMTAAALKTDEVITAIAPSFVELIAIKNHDIDVDLQIRDLEKYKHLIHVYLVYDFLKGKKTIEFPTRQETPWRRVYDKITEFNKLIFDDPFSTDSSSIPVTFMDVNKFSKLFPALHKVNSYKIYDIYKIVRTSGINIPNNYDFL